MEVRAGRVVFRTLPRYWDAAADGRKTCEVRLLSEVEYRQVGNAWHNANIDGLPFTVELSNTDSGEVIEKHVTWWESVGEGLGRHLAVFCWDPKEKVEQ